MTLLPSLAVPSPPKLRVKLFQCQPCQFLRCSDIHIPRQTYSTLTRSVKASMAEHNGPNEVNMRIGFMKEKFRATIPTPVQEFPWRKAEHIVLERLLVVVKEAVKWSLILFCVFSSLSDAVYTFSLNRELIMPVGLFVGILVADFLKEVSQELFHRPEEKDLKWHLLGMYCFFVFVKYISTFFATQSHVFLLHVGNGGLMQILWHYRQFMEHAQNKPEDNSTSVLESS